MKVISAKLNSQKLWVFMFFVSSNRLILKLIFFPLILGFRVIGMKRFWFNHAVRRHNLKDYVIIISYLVRGFIFNIQCIILNFKLYISYVFRNCHAFAFTSNFFFFSYDGRKERLSWV